MNARRTIFLLSPAHTGGERARLVFNPAARFGLAQRLQAGQAVPIGEIFSFLSGLYFRGKLVYAGRFANPPARVGGVWVITSNLGLVLANRAITLPDLRAFAEVDVDHTEPRYHGPLTRAARRLAARLPAGCEVVLLGSISTRKYLDPLLAVFGERLRFPADFVGRGDMSRGGLLLRAARAGRELEYLPVASATRHGPRPPKLEPRRWTRETEYFARCVQAIMNPAKETEDYAR